MSIKMREVYRFTCGSELGYVHVDNRGVHAPIEALPKNARGLARQFPEICAGSSASRLHALFFVLAAGRARKGI